MLQEKGRKPKNGGNTMNEKTRIQIEEMKRQTIGVEVEMNPQTISEQADTNIQQTETVITLGQLGTQRAESGNSKGM